MKKILALILAASLMLCAAYALAATGNVTIAVKGQDGFNDFISGMLVWGDKLLLSSYDTLYAWNSETRKLVEVQGYDQLQYMLTDEETGVIKAEEDEYCYFDSDLYVVEGKIYRMAQINDSDGNQTSYLVEIIISDDGELSLGDVIDLGDALSITDETDGETYSYTRSLQNPCSFGRTIYALSYGDSLELLSIDLDSETVDTVTLDTDYQIDSISPYTEGKLLMIGSNYDVDPVETALLVYDTQKSRCRKRKSTSWARCRGTAITRRAPSAMTRRAARFTMCFPEASGAWTSATTASARRRSSATCRWNPIPIAWR